MYHFNMDTVSSLGSNEDMVSSPDRSQCLTNEDTGGQLTVKNHKGTANQENCFIFSGIDIRTLEQFTRQGQKRTREQLIQIAKLEAEGITY